MLGVFRANLKKLPLPPEMPGDGYEPALKRGILLRFFVDNFNHTVSILLGKYGLLAYSADLHISPAPGPLFSMRSGISCIYRGGTKLKRKGKKVEDTGNEVEDLITCYKDLKEKGYQTPFEAMEVSCADFNYILYDSSPGWESAFVVHCWDGEPVYYGYDSVGMCIIADNPIVMMEVCGDTFKTVPQGNGILIPVVEKSEIQLVKAGSLGVIDPKKSAGKTTEGFPSCGSSSVADGSEGKSIEAKPLTGCSPKKTSGGKSVEGSPSGGSGIIKQSSGEAVTASPSGGSSSIKASMETRSPASPSGGSSSIKANRETRSPASPSGGSSSVKASRETRSAASPSGSSSSIKVSGGKQSAASPSGGSSSIKGSGGKQSAVSPSGGSSSIKASMETRSAASPSGGRSSIVDELKENSIKAKTSVCNSPKKTSVGSPSGDVSSTKGNREKRSAANPSGGISISKKGRG